MGAVSPIGIGVPAYIAGVRGGRSGTRLLDGQLDRSRVRTSAAADCAAFEPASVLPEAELKRLPRLVPMALAAAREAWGAAGLPEPGTADEAWSRGVAVLLGTGGGGADFVQEQSARRHIGRAMSLWTVTNATHGNLAGELSIHLGAHGPSHCISDGCASSSNALGFARDLLNSGRPGAPHTAVVVGADAPITAPTLESMELLGVISTAPYSTQNDAARASRPFCARRDGFVLGEGAWAMVLQRPGAAHRPPIGEFIGFGSTCDAFHRVRPEPDMRESARAMKLAIEDAGIGPGDVELMHYHGTATKLNDALETKAVKLAFSDHAHRLVGHSVKSQIGHPQGACGLAAAVATLGAMRGCDADPCGPFAPPTINLDEPDPDCDLDYTPGRAKPSQASIAMVNCLAFGAKNSAILLQI